MQSCWHLYSSLGAGGPWSWLLSLQLYGNIFLLSRAHRWEVGGVRWPEHPRTSYSSRDGHARSVVPHHITSTQHNTTTTAATLLARFSVSKFIILSSLLVSSEVRSHQKWRNTGRFKLNKSSYNNKTQNIPLQFSSSSDNQNLADCYSFYSSPSELELQSFLDLPCLDISKCCRPI